MRAISHQISRNSYKNYRKLVHLSFNNYSSSNSNMKKTKIPQIKQETEVDKKPDELYFSPRKTRNQRRQHVKIEYEIPSKIPKLEANVLPSIVKLEPKEEIEDEEMPIIEPKPSISSLNQFEFIPKKGGVTSRPPKVEVKEESWEPLNWRQHLQNIREMREKFPAPVDTMGCDKCADSNASEKTKRYHCLLSLMLSSQTKDQITFDAMNRLKGSIKGELTPEKLMQMEEASLAELLKPVSFYKTKAKHIKLSTQILIDQYDSDIPNSIEGLLKLPGVGKKMAFLAMNSAWNEVVGIGVDTHVHRISNWLKWVPKSTKTPEDTRVALEKWLPQELWDEVNHLMVGFGQTVCHAVRPKCDICVNASICPAKLNGIPKKSKSPRKTPEKEES